MKNLETNPPGRLRLSPDGQDSPPAPAAVLIVDDDPIAADSLAEYLAEEAGGSHRALTALDGDEALVLLEQSARAASAIGAAGPVGSRIGVVLCDLNMPKMNGMQTLRRIAAEHPSVAVVMLSGYGSIESAVQAVRAGAVDFLTKPVVDTELRVALDRAMRQHTLLLENQTLKSRLEQRFGLDNLVGADHRMLRIYDLVQAVAPNRTTVLMTGESGVGKSLIAHAIHQQSPRRDRPFVEISCGSIPETLLESELFGHVKGAFTGAHADKAGRFLAADGGTLFLDEINSASPGMQLKLLRVLQERRFEPVGSNRTVEVDVRVVLATNQPLENLVADGRFRQDLYYRINVVKIEVPPLRDRSGDITLLAEHFLRIHERELGRSLSGFTSEAMDSLRRYDFPGNVRELSNIVERAAVLSRSGSIGLEDLPPHVIQNAPPIASTSRAAQPGASIAPIDAAGADSVWTPTPLEEAMKEPERRILLRALKANSWNRQKTAEDLGINRTTLYKKMKSLGIESMIEDAGRTIPCPAAPRALDR